MTDRSGHLSRELKNRTETNFLSAIHPDMLDAMLEEEGISRAEAADQIQSMFGGLGSFGSINIDYEITDVENLSASDVADLEESYQDIGETALRWMQLKILN